MATANRSRMLEISIEPDFSEEMEFLRTRADQNVKDGRPARDDFDTPGRSTYIAVRCGKRIIGCARLTEERTANSGPAIAWLDPDAQARVSMVRGSEKLMHISRVVVDQKHQGFGIGSLLFQFAFELTRQMKYSDVVTLVEPELEFARFLGTLFEPCFRTDGVAQDTPGGVKVRLLSHRFRRQGIAPTELWTDTLAKIKKAGYSLVLDLHDHTQALVVAAQRHRGVLPEPLAQL